MVPATFILLGRVIIKIYKTFEAEIELRTWGREVLGEYTARVTYAARHDQSRRMYLGPKPMYILPSYTRVKAHLSNTTR